MDSIFRGDIVTRRGRLNAWIDALFVDHAVLRLFWTNFAVVVPARLYRSNHPTPRRLAAMARRHGLRTVINLRGQCNNGADALSRAAAQRLGLGFVDVPLHSRRAPQREEVLSLIAALEAAPPPALLHCKSGADRSGFAAGLYLLLNGGTCTDALRQLSLRYGHVRQSRAGVMDAIFHAYRPYEARLSFAQWVETEYDPRSFRNER